MVYRSGSRLVGGGAFGQTGGGTASFSGACGTDPSTMYTQGTQAQQIASYLNVACFRTATLVPNAGPGATGFGDTPRNAFRGPLQQNWDISLIKNIRLAETHDLRFRMDMFNMWNHPVFGFPSAVNIGTPTTFGQITTTVVPARLIQFGLTYRH